MNNEVNEHRKVISMHIFNEALGPDNHTWSEVSLVDSRVVVEDMFIEPGVRGDHPGVEVGFEFYCIDLDADTLVDVLRKGKIVYDNQIAVSDEVVREIQSDSYDKEGFNLTPSATSELNSLLVSRLSALYSPTDVEALCPSVYEGDGWSNIIASVYIPYDERGTVKDVYSRYTSAFEILKTIVADYVL